MSRFVTRKMLLQYLVLGISFSKTWLFRSSKFTKKFFMVVMDRVFFAVIKTAHSGPLPNVFNLEVSKEL